MPQIIIPTDDRVNQAILSAWRWLLRTPHKVVVVTAMGDAFVASESGQVFLLDTLEGSLVPVAPTPEAFDSILESDTYDTTWFNPSMLELKGMQGFTLKPGECFAYQLPPILGGPLASSNVAPISAVVHFTLSGQLHRHLTEHPNTPISGFTLKPS